MQSLGLDQIRKNGDTRNEGIMCVQYDSVLL